MFKLFHSILFASLAISSLNLWANARLSVSVTPNKSNNGENILFKISINTQSTGRVQAPDLSNLEDWELINTFRSESPRVTYVNGKVQYEYKADFSYFLRPLKSGSVSIPSINLDINGQPYKTDPISVNVASLPGGVASRPKRQNTQRPSARSNLPTQFQGGQNLSGNNTQAPGLISPDQVPQNDTFFIRPQISHNVAWAGQLIELSYFLFQRNRNLRNFEMAKFPDFRGFIKEELFITKNFTQERVQVGNEVLLKSEIIRYALFPIQTGTVKIEPFQIRAEVFTNPGDLINSLITGAPPPRMGNPIPMEKSSGNISIEVKELPPTPPDTMFTGAVGDFQLELKGPQEKLQADQPFTVQLTVAGKGNVKLIEEAKLPLPQGLELYQTKNSSELRPDTTGFKSFEYLILPRKQGTLTMPSFKWTYFDPNQGEYKIINTPPLRFNIEGSGLTSNDEKVEPTQQLSAYDVIPQPLKKQGAESKMIWVIFGGAQILLYAWLATLFVRRRNDARLSSHLKDHPWEKTAIKIKQKQYKNPVELCILVDLWTREFISGHIKSSHLHEESPRSEFEKTLKDKMQPEFHTLIQDMNQFWNDLDLARFAGSKKWPIQTRPDALFATAEKKKSLAKMTTTIIKNLNYFFFFL